MKKITQLSGQEINSVTPYHENICINTGNDKDGYKNYFISSAQLVIILSEFDFQAELKRTRTWLSLNINDWRVERFDEPRSY